MSPKTVDSKILIENSYIGLKDFISKTNTVMVFNSESNDSNIEIKNFNSETKESTSDINRAVDSSIKINNSKL